jgi:hypothetical protein
MSYPIFLSKVEGTQKVIKGLITPLTWDSEFSVIRTEPVNRQDWTQKSRSSMWHRATEWYGKLSTWRRLESLIHHFQERFMEYIIITGRFETGDEARAAAASLADSVNENDIFILFENQLRTLDSDRDAGRTNDQGGAKGAATGIQFFPFRELTPSCPAR